MNIYKDSKGYWRINIKSKYLVIRKSYDPILKMNNINFRLRLPLINMYLYYEYGPNLSWDNMTFYHRSKPKWGLKSIYKTQIEDFVECNTSKARINPKYKKVDE